MASERPNPEEIVMKLRQVEVPTGQGMPCLDAIRQIGLTEETYYNRKINYGRMGTDQVRELKRLQEEKERLRMAVSEEHYAAHQSVRLIEASEWFDFGHLRCAHTPVASCRADASSGIVMSPSCMMISAKKLRCGSSFPFPLGRL